MPGQAPRRSACRDRDRRSGSTSSSGQLARVAAVAARSNPPAVAGSELAAASSRALGAAARSRAPSTPASGSARSISRNARSRRAAAAFGELGGAGGRARPGLEPGLRRARNPRRAARALGGSRPGTREALERALDDVPRQIEHRAHQLGIDALEQHARRGAPPCVTIIGLMTNGADARSPPGSSRTFSMISRYSRNSLEYFSTSTCALTPEHLVAKLRLEAAGDAHHGRQRRDAERDAEDGEHGADRDEGALRERM